MSLFPRREDYLREHKKFAGRGKKDNRVVMKKQRLPSQFKSVPKFCRNCLVQLQVGKKICPQCGKETEPLKNRK